MRRSAVAFALLLVTAGCIGKEPAREPTSAVPTIAAASLPDGWRRCVNEVQGWSIGYPRAWFTTDVYTVPITGETVRRRVSACRLFDPRRFSLPADGEYPYTALWVGVASGPLETEVASLTDPTGYRVLIRERWIVLGHPAVHLEVESLGTPLPLKGTLRYGWVVDLGDGRSFSVLAQAGPGTSRERYGAYRRVADRALATVELPSVASPT